MQLGVLNLTPALVIALNVRAMMAEQQMSATELTKFAGIDNRTLSDVLSGESNPQSKTVGKIAVALNCPAEKLFDPLYPAFETFDANCNPEAKEWLQENRHLIKGWTVAEVDEIVSHNAHGGPLTRYGAETAVEKLNQRRELAQKLAVLMGGPHAEAVRVIIESLYETTLVRE